MIYLHSNSHILRATDGKMTRCINTDNNIFYYFMYIDRSGVPLSETHQYRWLFRNVNYELMTSQPYEYIIYFLYYYIYIDCRARIVIITIKATFRQ